MPDSPCVMQPPQLFPQSSIMSTNMCSVVKNHALSHIKWHSFVCWYIMACCDNWPYYAILPPTIHTWCVYMGKIPQVYAPCSYDKRTVLLPINLQVGMQVHSKAWILCLTNLCCKNGLGSVSNMWERIPVPETQFCSWTSFYWLTSNVLSNLPKHTKLLLRTYGTRL